MVIRDAHSLAHDLLALLEEVAPEGVARAEFEKNLAGTGPPERVLCLGKAAPALARAAYALWPGSPGLLYGTAPEGPLPKGFDVLWGDHPVPTEGNLGKTALVRRWLQEGQGPLLACVSGGTSSLLVEPRPPWTLAAKAALTSALWVRGADIRDLNGVRARVSGVKCGGLRASAGRWPVTTAVWSDVGPSAARLVGSGPTLPWSPRSGAESILRRYDLKPPLPLPPSLAPPPTPRGDRWFVLFDALGLRRSCIARLREHGFAARAIPCAEGRSAKAVAENLCRDFATARSRRPAALVGVGEPRVDPRGATGAGGRCSHLAAEVALALLRERQRAWAFAALATDGVDGNAGAGAWVDSASAPSQNDLRSALRAFDTGSLWERNGTLVPRSPSGNNLRDVWVLVETGERA